MSEIFFWDWSTWAKLSFVLGCTLIIVLAVAAIVKFRNICKMRAYMKTEGNEMEKGELVKYKRSSDEIPFGIKAMEEEPDIEGVWNSRTSTPLQSPLLSPRETITSWRAPMFQNESRQSSISSASQFDINIESKEIAKMSASRTVYTIPSSPQDQRMQARSRSIDSIRSITLNNCPYPKRRSINIGGSKKNTAEHENVSCYDHGTYQNVGSSKIQRQCSRRHSVSSNDTSNTITRTIIIGRPLLNLSSSSTGTSSLHHLETINRMEAHRQFHAAESGQLLPRSQRASSESRFFDCKSTTSETSSDQDLSRRTSWQGTGDEVVLDVKATKRVRTMTSPDVKACRASIEVHQPLKKPPSAWTDRTQTKVDEKLSEGHGSRQYRIWNGTPNSTAPVIHKDSSLPREVQSSACAGDDNRQERKSVKSTVVKRSNSTSHVKSLFSWSDPLCQTSKQPSKPNKLRKRSSSSSRSKSNVDMNDQKDHRPRRLFSIP